MARQDHGHEQNHEHAHGGYDHEHAHEGPAHTHAHANDAARRAVIAGLNGLLADSFMLYVKTHGFHWNVVGPRFYQLHKLFEEQYTALWEALDELAERLRALGARAPGSFAEFVKLTALREESHDVSAVDMIRQLLEGHRDLAHRALHLVEAADAAGDAGTADLATIRGEAHDKAAWMLESLLQSES